MKLFIHIFFDLLSDFLLVWTIFNRMIDNVFSFEFSLRLHLRITYFYSPFLDPLRIHIELFNANKL